MTFNRSAFLRQFLSLIIIILWVSLTFLPALKGEFLNWDDHAHVVNNSAVRNFDVAKMFYECVQKIYIPLTSLSFAVEHKFFGDHPFGYRLDNLILHVLNSILVYFFALRLGLGLAGALISALLFGVHPMRVESVAWITERKDLLYAFFYLLSLLMYLRYLTTDNKKEMFTSFALGFLSLLAKPMALSLPVVLIVLDWFKKRKLAGIVWREKILLVLVFAPAVWMTYQWHVRNPVQNIAEASITWIWTFNFYLWKFFVPRDLSAIYQFPEPADLTNPIHVFSLMSFACVLLLLYRFRKNHWLVFAMLFYLGSIFFLLRFDETKDINIVADRFMYLPSLGICLLAGAFIEDVLRRNSKHEQVRPVVFLIACAVIGILSLQSIKQVNVWNNSVTLWTRVIEKYPQQFIAYNDRAVAFISRGRNDLALNDYAAILKFDPDNADAHYNRGLLLQKLGRHAGAIADFDEVIKKYPRYERVYNSRGKSYEIMGRDDLAVADYTQAVTVTPAYVDAYIQRGNVFNRRGLLDKAFKDYLRVLEINPQHARALNNCAAIYAKLQNEKKAFEYVNRAIVLDPSYADAFYNRSVLYHQKGEEEKSAADVKRYRQLEEKSSANDLTESK